MAWTTSDRDALKAAIAKGEKAVSFADRSVTYRSLDEMLGALGMIEAEVAGPTDRPRAFRIVPERGL